MKPTVFCVGRARTRPSLLAGRIAELSPPTCFASGCLQSGLTRTYASWGLLRCPPGLTALLAFPLSIGLPTATLGTRLASDSRPDPSNLRQDSKNRVVARSTDVRRACRNTWAYQLRPPQKHAVPLMPIQKTKRDFVPSLRGPF